MQIKLNTATKHLDTMSGLSWSGSSRNELYSFGEDGTAWRWQIDSSQKLSAQSLPNLLPEGVCAQGVAVSSNATAASGRAPSAASAPETIAIAGSDGKCYLINKMRLDKTLDAHNGACLAIRWSPDQTTLVTCGEEGAIKLWSRSGMLRSQLVQAGASPVYAVCFAPDGEALCYATGRTLTIKRLQAGTKPLRWVATEPEVVGSIPLVTCVDWSATQGLIISGGEDRRYRVWDIYGRQLYCSTPHEHVISSVAWRPEGNLFAMATFDTLRLCDKMGSSLVMEKHELGSVWNMIWSADGTQLACAGANGSLAVAHMTGHSIEWQHLQIVFLESNQLQVTDLLTNLQDVLEFNDRIVKVSVAYQHLIVVTTMQCHLYNAVQDKAFSTTPTAVIDLSQIGRIVVLQQSSTGFVLVDTNLGIQIFGYDGKLLSAPKHAGLKAEQCHAQTVSLSNDTLACKDRQDEKALVLFDMNTGKSLLSEPLRHSLDICELALDPGSIQGAPLVSRHIAIIDQNRDVYISSLYQSVSTSNGTKTVSTTLGHKLTTMCDALLWHSSGTLLATLCDGRLYVFGYAMTPLVDVDLAPLTKYTISDNNTQSKMQQLVSFTGSRITVRRSDGTITVHAVSPFLIAMHELVRQKQWDNATRLCRHVNKNDLWACLAALALHQHQLSTAATAYAALDDTPKLEFLRHVQSQTSPASRDALLALLRRQPREAEAIYLAAGTPYQAIKMYLDLYQFDRALTLALKAKTHVDTVLYKRQKYLRQQGRMEQDPRFLQCAERVPVDESTVLAKMAAEEK